MEGSPRHAHWDGFPTLAELRSTDERGSAAAWNKATPILVTEGHRCAARIGDLSERWDVITRTIEAFRKRIATVVTHSCNQDDSATDVLRKMYCAILGNKIVDWLRKQCRGADSEFVPLLGSEPASEETPESVLREAEHDRGRGLWLRRLDALLSRIDSSELPESEKAALRERSLDRPLFFLAFLCRMIRAILHLAIDFRVGFLDRMQGLSATESAAKAGEGRGNVLARWHRTLPKLREMGESFDDDDWDEFDAPPNRGSALAPTPVS